MAEERKSISVINPINPAIARIGDMLFKPFDFTKWLTIGFCAWLAYLGEKGFSGVNFRMPSDRDGFKGIGPDARLFFETYLPLIITIGIIVFVIVLAIAIVCMWLRSRGQFMFLHSVVSNDARIGEGWNRYSRAGNKLFVFNLIVSFIFLMIASVFAAVIIFCVMAIVRGDGGIAVGIIGLIPTVFTIFFFIILAALFMKLTFDFVVPTMYLRQCGPIQGWRFFWALLSANKGNFLLYILFQIVINIAIGITVFIASAILCCTCCCLLLLASLPYIWAVALLPVLIFKRSYSLYFLSQFGPEWDVFTARGTG
jgi:hypothetical protein